MPAARAPSGKGLLMTNAIARVGVIGAGTMGSGIAQICAMAGYDVIVRDLKPEWVERCLATIGKSLDRMASGGKLAAADRDAALARIRSTTELGALADCDLVVEAIIEDYE